MAACWGVGCNADAANAYEKEHNPVDVSHSWNNCGTPSNQVIFDDNNDGTADRMVETGTNGLGTLACTIYTDSSYATERSVSTVEVGQTIYWTTSASGNRVWHHVGTVSATVPGHPNRS